MRAIELWRLAPRLRMRSAHEPDVAPLPPELEKRVRAAFVRPHPKRIEPRVQSEHSRDADEPSTHANRAAFLVLEGELEALAARIARHHRWHRRDRYRDLILFTRLVRLQYDHLIGGTSAGAGSASPPDLPSDLDGYRPARWARPWGVGQMLELRAALIHYRHRLDRLTRWLPARTRTSAATEAESEWDSALRRFETALGRRELDVAARGPNGRRTKPEIREPAGEASAAAGAKPRRRLRFTRPHAIVAAVLVAAVLGTIIADTRGDRPSNAAGPPSPAVQSGPGHPALPAGDRPREPQPQRGDRTGRRALHRSTPAAQPESAATAVEPAPRSGARVSAPASPASRAPATSAPPASPSARSGPAAGGGPAQSSPPAHKPGPGPVSSLPPPVSSLPPPVSPPPGPAGGGAEPSPP